MKPKLALAAVTIAAIAAITVVMLGGSGSDDDGGSPGAAQQQSGAGADDGDEESGDAVPLLRTIASRRAEGRNATAATAGTAARPREFWLRVSAAPEQAVKGSWNVSCAGAGNELETFEVTAPQLMKLRVPTKNAASCIAGVSAQLSGEGRLSVAILRDR